MWKITKNNQLIAESKPGTILNYGNNMTNWKLFGYTEYDTLVSMSAENTSTKHVCQFHNT